MTVSAGASVYRMAWTRVASFRPKPTSLWTFRARAPNPAASRASTSAS